MPLLVRWSGMSRIADRGRLRPRAGRRRDREQRLQRRGRLAALADRRVDVVHDRRRVGGDEVGDLGGVEARPAADAHEAVEVAVDGEVGRLLQRLRRRLDADAVEDDGLDALRLDRLHDALGDPGADDAGITDHHHPRGAEALELPARVRGRARPELDRGRLEGEDRLVRHATPVVSRSSAGLRTKRSVGAPASRRRHRRVRLERLACEVRRDDGDERPCPSCRARQGTARRRPPPAAPPRSAGRSRRRTPRRAGSPPRRPCSACGSRTARRSTPPAARTSGRGRC